jgi:hypothetical protein
MMPEVGYIMTEVIGRVCIWSQCDISPVKHVRYDYQFERPVLPRTSNIRGVEIPFQYRHGDICEKHLAELAEKQRISQMAFGVCCP